MFHRTKVKNIIALNNNTIVYRINAKMWQRDEISRWWFVFERVSLTG